MSMALIEQQALRSLDLEVRQLDRVLEALAHRDLELAELVIAEGARLDHRYLEVHQAIVSHLAVKRPGANDVRLVAVLLHVIKHVERIGDQCVHVAKLIPVSCRPSAVHLELLSELGRMGVGEQTAFAVTGLFREFSGATHVGRH